MSLYHFDFARDPYKLKYVQSIGISLSELQVMIIFYIRTYKRKTVDTTKLRFYLSPHLSSVDGYVLEQRRMMTMGHSDSFVEKKPCRSKGKKTHPEMNKR